MYVLNVGSNHRSNVGAAHLGIKFLEIIVRCLLNILILDIKTHDNSTMKNENNTKLSRSPGTSEYLRV